MVSLTLGAPPRGVTQCSATGSSLSSFNTLETALPIGREALLRLGGKQKETGDKGASENDFPEERIVIPVGVTPATLKKYTLYEILGFGGELGASADTEVIKKAYHKAVLMYHPDKAQFKTADGKEDRTVFLKIQEAFNVLCSEPKRRAYDSQLPFDESIPTEEYCDNYITKPSRFFKVFDPIFKRNARFAVKKPVPELGDTQTPIAQVLKFYDYWIKFDSWRDFTGVGAEHKPDDAGSREEKRYMQKENEKKAKVLKKAEMDRIIRLVMLAEKTDPRIKDEKEKKKNLKDAAKNATESKAKRQADEEASAKEWSEKLEADAKGQSMEEKETLTKEEKETIKKNKEKIRKALTKIRNTFKELLMVSLTLGHGPDPKYGYLTDEEVGVICANLEIEDITEMNKSMGGEEAVKDSAAFVAAGLEGVVKVKLEKAKKVVEDKADDLRITREAEKREKESPVDRKKREHPSDRVVTEEEGEQLDVAMTRYPATLGAGRWLSIANFVNDRVKPALIFTQEEAMIAAHKRTLASK